MKIRKDLYGKGIILAIKNETIAIYTLNLDWLFQSRKYRDIEYVIGKWFLDLDRKAAYIAVKVSLLDEKYQCR